MKTKEELEQYRQEIPPMMRKALEACEGCDFSLHEEQDEYGHYATGLFHYQGKDILITIDEGMWHVSINSDHPIGYYELKEVRYLSRPLPHGTDIPATQRVYQSERELFPPV